MSDSLNVEEDRWNRVSFVRMSASQTMPARIVAIDGIEMLRILDGTYSMCRVHDDLLCFSS
jgi:hypothetical protein